MTPERWRQITGIFNGAVAIADAGAREAYLLNACAHDSSLRAEIESLLAAQTKLTATIDEPPPPDHRGRARLDGGTRLGPYRVEALLGAGGMGEVYRAHDTRLGRTVALKILPPHLRKNQQLHQRFEREARAIAGLNHPYICTLFDIGRHEDIDFLVMELIEGETLSSVLFRERLPVGRSLTIAREVAEALAAAHAKGIIHRDIKPSNIMLAAAGHVKVVDFGLARESSLFHGNDSTREEGTEPGILVGTPRYMSPEQALGQPLDPRTDIFALGVVLFECLTGELPFQGETKLEYLQNLLSGRMRSLRDVWPDAPAGLQELVARCLERDVSKRLNSAAWLATELERADPPAVAVRGAAYVGLAALAAVALVAVLLLLTGRESTVEPPVDSVLRRFTTAPGEELDSQLSPDGMWVSFVATESGRRRLQVRQIDAGEAREVTLPSGELKNHLWSPDQRSYACLMSQGSQWVVQIVPAYFGADMPTQSLPLPQIPRTAILLRWLDTGIYLQVEESDRSRSLRRLDLKTGAVALVSGPWSKTPVRGFDVEPGGRRVVWSASSDDPQRDDLWVADIDKGGGARRVTGIEDSSRKRFPLWKDARKVVYQSTRGGQVDLWELDVTSGRAARLTSDPGIEEPDSVSANGSISYTLAAQQAALVTWKVRGGEGVQISSGGLSDFAPSTSAAAPFRVAFQRSTPTPIEGYLQTDSDIFVADLSTPPTSLVSPRKVATGVAPRLSPDGQLIAYLQRTQVTTPQVNLVVKSVDNSMSWNPSTSLTLPTNVPFPVEWTEQTVVWTSPKDLYFIERPRDSGRARIVHYPVGSTPEPIASTETTDRITDIYPSPNGRSISYLTRSTAAKGDVWVFQLHSLDLTTRESSLVADLGASRGVQLRGWLRPDSEVLVARATAYAAPTWRFELLAIARDGAIRQIGVIDHVVSISSLRPGSPELYFAQSDGGMGNLYAFSFATRKPRALTQNLIRDISFGAVTSVGSDHIVGIKHERTSDIYLLDARPLGNSR